MLTPDQEKEYDDLKEEVKEYSKYSKWQKRNSKYGLGTILFLVIFFILSYFAKADFAFYFFAAFFFGTFYVLFSDSILGYLARRNSPNADKLVAFFVYATIESLDRYFDPRRADTPQRKDKFRKRAIENGTDFLSQIENSWIIGEFGLAQAVFGKTVTEFKELLSKRLIPTIKEGDAETLVRKANDRLWQLSVFLHQPSLDMLKHINESLANNLPEMPITKEDYLKKLVGFLRSHMLLTHVLSILGIIGSTLVVYFAGLNYFGLPPDSAYITSVQFIAILVVGYLTIIFTVLIRRKEK